MMSTAGSLSSTALATALVALLGAANGSFAELVSRRLPAHRSLWWPPSSCEDCGRRLALWHNLPILSFLVLRGRCAFCRALIPLRGWAVEVLMAAVAVALWARFGPSFAFLLWMPMSALLMAVALCDLDYFWVPDPLVGATAALALLAAAVDGARGVLGALLGVVPALLLWALGALFARLGGREGLGLGDVKWAATLGLATGPVAAFGLLFWASVQAVTWAVVARALAPLARRRPGPPAPLPAAIAPDADWVPPPGAIPFAVFLSLAAVEVTCCPDLCGGQAAAAATALIHRWLGAWAGG